MKKIKFLSFAVMAAFMALGLSSCEKENFGMDLEIPKASPATVSISPNVIAFINGSAENVTGATATKITYENYPIEADKETGKISQTVVTINVEYTATVPAYGQTLTKIVEAKETVTIPALDRGMNCTLTPTIVLSVNTIVDAPELESGNTTSLNAEVTDFKIWNKTDYYYTDINGEYEYKSGTEVDRNSINWLQKSFEYDADINGIIDAFDNVTMEKKKFSGVTVMSQSQTIIKVETMVTQTEYTIKKKVSLSKADSAEAEIEIVKFNVKNYTDTTDNSGAPKSDENPGGYQVNIGLDGTGHGHGHGHGHGNYNAGGGITMGE